MLPTTYDPVAPAPVPQERPSGFLGGLRWLILGFLWMYIGRRWLGVEGWWRTTLWVLLPAIYILGIVPLMVNYPNLIYNPF